MTWIGVELRRWSMVPGWLVDDDDDEDVGGGVARGCCWSWWWFWIICTDWVPSGCMVLMCTSSLLDVANDLLHSEHFTTSDSRSFKCIFFLCITMSRFRVKDLPHVSQWWFLMPVCVPRCLDKSPLVMNPLLHTGQIWSRMPADIYSPLEKGSLDRTIIISIPEWIFLCCWKLPRALNCLLQISHWKGFSPVCVLKCMVRLCFWAKRLGQKLHGKGRSPEWQRMCICSWAAHLKVLLHS